MYRYNPYTIYKNNYEFLLKKSYTYINKYNINIYMYLFEIKYNSDLDLH